MKVPRTWNHFLSSAVLTFDTGPSRDVRVGHSRHFRGQRNSSCVKGIYLKKLAGEALYLLITHRFKLGKILDAYETFGNAAKTKALKVIIEA